MTDHPKTWTIDQYIAGELKDADLAAVRAHVSDCPACGQYVTAMAIEQEQLMQAVPPSAFASRIQRQANQPAPVKSRQWLWWLLPACAAAAVALFVTTRSMPDMEPPRADRAEVSDQVRWMGSSAVNVRLIAKRNGHTVELQQAPLAKDQLQIELRAKDPSRKHYAAVFVNEAGRVQPVLPAGASQPFEFQGTGWIPGSIVLDVEQPGTELFIVVRSASFDVAAVATAIQEQLNRQGEAPLSIEGLIYRTSVEVR